jgi:secreted PhoX family phosphatase
MAARFFNTNGEDFAARKLTSNWPDGHGKLPRSANVVITRADNGGTGS